MKIRDLIKQIRQDLGETQAEFAKRFNTHANTVSRWENGTYDVPNKIIEAVLNKKQELITCTRCNGSGSEYKIVLEVSNLDEAQKNKKRLSNTHGNPIRENTKGGE